MTNVFFDLFFQAVVLYFILIMYNILHFFHYLVRVLNAMSISVIALTFKNWNISEKAHTYRNLQQCLLIR